jgi:hypothetical protein
MCVQKLEVEATHEPSPHPALRATLSPLCGEKAGRGVLNGRFMDPTRVKSFEVFPFHQASPYPAQVGFPATKANCRAPFFVFVLAIGRRIG